MIINVIALTSDSVITSKELQIERFKYDFDLFVLWNHVII